jgi:hypothetical protein
VALIGFLGWGKNYLQAKTTAIKTETANTKSDLAINTANTATTAAHAANAIVSSTQNTLDSNTARLTKLENGGTVAIVNKVLSDKGIA